jgi:secreted trypsin-like serine protease
MMKQVNQKRAKRAGLQKVLWTANITQLSLADDASEFDTKIVGGSSASAGEFPYYGKSFLISRDSKLL